MVPDDAVAEPLLLPLPPVLPVQPLKLILATPDPLTLPDNVEHVIPFGFAAPAGPLASAVTPASGTKAADPTTAPSMIRVFNIRTTPFRIDDEHPHAVQPRSDAHGCTTCSVSLLPPTAGKPFLISAIAECLWAT